LLTALNGQVELALLEVPTADHRQHASVPGIDCDERRRRPVCVRQPLVDRFLREPLNVEVDRCVDLESGPEDLSRSVIGNELLLDVLGEVGLATPRGRQAHLVGVRQLRLVRGQRVLTGDQVLVDHEAEDSRAAQARTPRVLDRVERTRACR